MRSHALPDPFSMVINECRQLTVDLQMFPSSPCPCPREPCKRIKEGLLAACALRAEVETHRGQRKNSKGECRDRGAIEGRNWRGVDEEQRSLIGCVAERQILMETHHRRLFTTLRPDNLTLFFLAADHLTSSSAFQAAVRTVVRTVIMIVHPPHPSGIA